jgi:hypothetical protein
MATLIRAFPDRALAQRLHDELLQAGLSADRVRMLNGVQGEDEEGREPGDRGVLSSFGHFFASALGGDTPDGNGGHYTEALQRGDTVIAVNADSAAEERLARGILDGSAPGAG